MRPALLTTKRRGQPVNRVVALPPPIGGWNARDPISGMGETDALALDNWVVIPGGIESRAGRLAWATGLGSFVESLMEYAPVSGVRKLFAAAGTSFYDVTASGPVGAPVVTGLASSRWQHVHHASPAGTYLTAVDGASDPRIYDGTSWGLAMITGTGLTVSSLVNVHSHQNRLWFIQKGTADVWYLAPQAVAGTLTRLPLGPFLTLGGYLIAMGSWTHDGGDGPDDYAVFISSEGETLVYQGTDPASNSTFSLVGRYYLPKPLGRRCFAKSGADLVVLTEAGVLPLSQAGQVGPAGAANIAVSNKIDAAWTQSVSRASGLFGWEAIAYPRGNIMLVNVPVRERQVQQQFVLGTKTAGWSRFTNLNAGCWSLFGDRLMMGGNDGTVWQYDGLSDAGQPILVSYQHAFSAMKRSENKLFVLAKARMNAPYGFQPSVHIKTDFDTSAVDYRVVAALSIGTPWGSPWGSPWGTVMKSVQDWQGVEGAGTFVSIASRSSTTAKLSWYGTDLAYQQAPTSSVL